MRSYIEFDCAPTEESCVSVNREGDYHEAMQEEARRYKALMEHRFADRPDGTNFAIRWCNHDFGSYAELRFYFDEDDDGAGQEYAIHIERNLPATWSDTAPCPFTKEPEEEAVNV